MGNGALDEAMDLFGRAIADNSQVEQPYRTHGQIELDENGSIHSISVEGILVDFDIIQCITKEERSVYSDEELEEMGWEKKTDYKNGISDWRMLDSIYSEEWE